MDSYAQYNRKAWDNQVATGNEWTIPVTSEQRNSSRPPRRVGPRPDFPTIPVPQES